MNKKLLRLVLAVMLSLLLAACSSGTSALETPEGKETVSSAAPPAPTVVLQTIQPVQTPEPEPLSYANPQTYAVRYTVTIRNDGFSPTDVQLYLPMPGEWDAQQDLVITEISPEPESQVEEMSGNAMLYWQMSGTPEKNTTAEFSLGFTFTAYETITHINAQGILPYAQDSEEVQLYTKAERYIESDDPQIIALADSLVDSETDSYQIVKAFYDYIVDTAEYELLGQGLNGAKYLLDNGEGECGDYSALFIALCRAKGIPARPVVGYWAISGNDQTHVWAEFFLEGIGWIPVDATIGQQSEEGRLYYFGNMDNQRVILSKGYNTPLVPEAPDGFIAPILQTPMWWFWGSGDADQFSMTRDWLVNKTE